VAGETAQPAGAIGHVESQPPQPRRDPYLLRSPNYCRRGYLTGADDLVFLSESGGRLDYERMKDAFYAGLVSAGLGHLREQDGPVTFHDLRHTFGTRMAAAGVPVRSLQEWMGHADLKTTLRYMHYAPRADDAARLSAFIAAQTEPNVVPLDAAAA
jgi:integrase